MTHVPDLQPKHGSCLRPICAYLRKPQASADAPTGAMACEAKAMTCHAKEWVHIMDILKRV